MDDYYSMLGIDADASVDDIRGAYRVRKDGLDTGSEAGRNDAVKLNKAWNVLSDPYQRGRYDEQRASAAETGELGTTEAIEPSTSNGRSKSGSEPKGLRAQARNSRQERARATREARLAKQSTPSIPPPPGTHYPATRQRIIAMVIDLVVLVIMFIGVSQVGAQAVAKAEKPDTVKLVTAKDDAITAENKVKSDADSAVSADKKANNTAKQAIDQKASDDAKAKLTQLNKERDDAFSKLNVYFLSGLFLAFVLGFLYLAVPSAISGRTLGKKTQHLKTVREDGSPLGVRGSVVRYGLVVLVTLVLYLLLRQIAAVVVLFGVTMWMRNNNMQGMHDRFAHTLVVADDTNTTT